MPAFRMRPWPRSQPTWSGYTAVEQFVLEPPHEQEQLTDPAELMSGSLSAAQITMIDRRRTPGWGGQLQKYVVSVQARDGEDTVGRVLAVLEPHGSSPRSPWQPDSTTSEDAQSWVLEDPPE